MWSNKFSKVLIFLTVLLLLLLNASGNIESLDGLGSLNMARNFVYHGVWNVAEPKYNLGIGTHPVGDKYYSGSSLGYAVAMIPAVVISKIIYAKNGFVPVTNFPLESDYLLTFLASFVNPILGFALFVVVYLTLKFLTKNDFVSIVMSTIMIFATNLLPLAKHSFVHMSFTLFVMISFYGLIRLFDNRKQWWWLVISIISFVLLKFCYNFSFLLPLLGLIIFCGIELNVKLRKSQKIWGVIILTVLGMLLYKLLGLNWELIKWILVGEGTRRDVFQALWGQLFSPGRSLFVYSPILILAVYITTVNWRNIYSKLFTIMLFIYIAFYSVFDIWHGELSYGPRYLAVLIPFGVIVLAVNWKIINKWVLSVLVLMGLYVQLIGITIPYETQYQGIEFMGINESKVISRQDQFDYWSLGEFMPRLSPVYRLKRNFVHRLILIPRMWQKTGDYIFAGGATLPLDNGVRRVGNNFKIESKNQLIFSQVTINKVSADINNLKICVEMVCGISKGKVVGDNLLFRFDKKIIVNPGQNIDFTLDTKVGGQIFELERLFLDKTIVDISSYNLLLEDSFFNQKTIKSDDNKILYQRYYDFRSVANMTADFWWVKIFIYRNLPIEFKIFFGSILFGLTLCILLFGFKNGFQLISKSVKSKKL